MQTFEDSYGNTLRVENLGESLEIRSPEMLLFTSAVDVEHLADTLKDMAQTMRVRELQNIHLVQVAQGLNSGSDNREYQRALVELLSDYLHVEEEERHLIERAIQ